MQTGRLVALVLRVGSVAGTCQGALSYMRPCPDRHASTVAQLRRLKRRWQAVVGAHWRSLALKLWSHRRSSMSENCVKMVGESLAMPSCDQRVEEAI